MSERGKQGSLLIEGLLPRAQNQDIRRVIARAGLARVNLVIFLTMPFPAKLLHVFTG